jgi:hypothetical protein
MDKGWFSVEGVIGSFNADKIKKMSRKAFDIDFAHLTDEQRDVIWDKNNELEKLSRKNAKPELSSDGGADTKRK